MSSKFKFSKKSEAKLMQAHPDLQVIMREVLFLSVIDFGISESHRTAERQAKLYSKGLSKLDGVTKKSNHQTNPSHAVDIYAYHTGKAQFDTPSMCFIAGSVMAVARDLFERGVITHKIRWGGNWDGDGVIMHDQNFQDLCHFELVK